MRNSLLLPFLALAGAAAVAGCGSGDGGITDEEPPTSDGPLVTYEKGGGFAPVSQKLVIEADGSGVASAELYGPQTEDGTGPETVSEDFSLTDAELADLTEAVTSTELETLDADTVCADCFTYGIETANGSTDFDDAMLGGFGDEPPAVPDDVAALNTTLGEILAEYVPGPEAQAGS